METAGLSIEEHGAARHDRAALSISDGIDNLLANCPRDRAGVRLHGTAGLADLLATDTAVGRIAAAYLGSAARPVRAILFDKTPGANWALGWHQDRTIAVRKREDAPGFGPWSTKAGI